MTINSESAPLAKKTFYWQLCISAYGAIPGRGYLFLLGAIGVAGSSLLGTLWTLRGAEVTAES
ncbi:MAG: hypothetical protein QGF09_02645 [Rhodospirillales bacterium]|jgi:hypothetical protein|nr:hypothetical protein [Rhodospirillales bacterium]